MVLPNPLGNILSSVGGALTGDAKRALIRSTLPGFLEADISGAQALSIYRDAGLGIRTSDFYAIQRDVLGIYTRSSRIRYVSGGKVPTDAVFDEARSPQQARYRFVGLVEYMDPDTGESAWAHMSFETNDKASRTQIESDIAEAFEASDTFNGKKAIAVNVKYGYIDRSF